MAVCALEGTYDVVSVLIQFQHGQQWSCLLRPQLNMRDGG